MKTRIVARALLVIGFGIPVAHAQEGMPVLKQVIAQTGWPCTNKAIAIKGEWMAISCAGRFDPANGSSRIEMWRRVNGQWILHQTLTGPLWEPASNHGLCASTLRFDSTGTRFVAGDPRFNGFGPPPEPCGGDADEYFEMYCGERVRVFVRNGEQWALDNEGDLSTAPALASVSRRFGYSADIEGENVIVGGPQWAYNGTTGWGAFEAFSRRDTGWFAMGGDPFPTGSTCTLGIRLLGYEVFIAKPPLPRFWITTFIPADCSETFGRSYFAVGTFSGTGALQQTSSFTFNNPAGSSAARMRQDQDRILHNSTGSAGIRVYSGTLEAIQTIPDPLAPSWGTDFTAQGGRVVTATADNRIYVYDWIAGSGGGTPGGYQLRGVMSGPSGNPVVLQPRSPSDACVVSGEFIVLDGATLAIQAQSGDILLYEFFPDCNGNNQSDLDEIAADPLRDCDSTGSLDECEPLPSPPPVPTRSTWKAPLGGSFQDVLNWCRQSPVNSTAIEFGIPFSYGVTLSQTREVKNITVSNGFPTLNFNSPSTTLRSSTSSSVPTSDRFLRVGTVAGQPASLGVLGGTINTSFGEVGSGGGTQGTIVVGPGGKVISTSELCVGCEGDGTLLLQNGGQATSQKAVIGKSALTTGLATVESTNQSLPSRWTSTLGIDVKNGTLAVNSGGIIDSPALGVILYAGGNLTGSGTIIGPVTNFGSAAGNCGASGFTFGAPIVHQSGGLAPGGRLPAGSQTYGDYSTIGTLTINGLYQQIAANPDLGTNSGSLLVEIAKEGNEIKHDRIVVNGPATLGGGLFVTLATDPSKEAIDFTGLPVFTATSIDPDRPNFDIAFMPALPNGRFVKVDAPSSLEGGGGAITISTSDLASLLGFGGSANTTFDLEPLAAAVGDFDGANGNDVAVTLKGTGTSGAGANGSLLVLFNDGDGGLDKVVQMPNQLGRDPVGIVAAPLRPGRKVPDLALVNQGSNTLQVLYNDGIGNFVTGQTVSTGAGSAPSSIDAVPIFAEDPSLAGIFDLVITNSGLGSLSVYFNPGAGAPIPLLLLPAGTQPRAVRGVDIDNNRFFDLVAANKSTGSVSVFMRQPTDPKNPSVSFGDALNIAVGDDPVDLVTGDLDGDGRTDITTVNRLSNSVSVLLNRTTTTGEATFAPSVTLPTGGEPESIVLGDFDQDTGIDEPADLDIALTARATTEPGAPRVIKVLRNDRSNGVLALAPADDIVVPGAPKLIVADEFDPVAGADIVSLSLGGAQNFKEPPPAATASVVPSTVKPKCGVGDVNCDGIIDANDLAILLAAWGTSNPQADIDRSGTVDGGDLATLLANWGSTGAA